MSVLHALLFFGGIPLLVIVVVWLLVMGPSIGRSSRTRATVVQAAPEWFGVAPPGSVEQPELPPGPGPQGRQPGDAGQPGGASAQW